MPDRHDVTSSFTDGRNTLELVVTYLWPIRLIGDLQPSATVRYTHNNIRAHTKDSSLPPPGILEPAPRQNYVRE